MEIIKIKSKKIISVILAVLMAVSITAGLDFSASAATNVLSGSCGANVKFVLNSDGVLTLTGTGETNNYNITANNPWYSIRSDIKTVIINEGVTTINSSLFFDCVNLTSVTLPSSLQEIGNHAFEGCRSLNNIIIPQGLKTVVSRAFYDCSSLPTISLPSSLESIGAMAFYDCYKLTDITINSTDCVIYNDYDTIPYATTIHGYEGSTAQKYAKTNSRSFVALPITILSSGNCGATGSNVTYSLNSVGY